MARANKLAILSSRKPSVYFFENSSRQTRVKKKKKKGFSPSREREPVRRIIYTGMEDFPQLWIRGVSRSPPWDDFVRETDLLDI